MDGAIRKNMRYKVIASCEKGYPLEISVAAIDKGNNISSVMYVDPYSDMSRAGGVYAAMRKKDNAPIKGTVNIDTKNISIDTKAICVYVTADLVVPPKSNIGDMGQVVVRLCDSRRMDVMDPVIITPDTMTRTILFGEFRRAASAGEFHTMRYCGRKYRAMGDDGWFFIKGVSESVLPVESEIAAMRRPRVIVVKKGITP
jgi:hypothetical protein